MTSRPSVTIAVPVYNGARYLDQCLDSARGQSYDDLEIVVIDDRSTDRSLDIARRHAAADNRVRVIANPERLGLAGNFSSCITQSRGEWVKYLLQDDLLHVDCVARMVAAAAAPVVICGREYRYEGVGAARRASARGTLERAITQRYDDATTLSGPELAGLAARHLAVNFVGEPTALMVHRQTALESGPFDSRLLQWLDLEFVVRIASRHGATVVPATLATFRVHRGQETAHQVATQALRTEQLDALLYLGSLAYDPAYQHVRDAARTTAPGVDLAQVVQERIAVAWSAVRADRRRDDQGRTAMEQWADLVVGDPVLGPFVPAVIPAPPRDRDPQRVRARVARALQHLPGGEAVIRSLERLRRRLHLPD